MIASLAKKMILVSALGVGLVGCVPKTPESQTPTATALPQPLPTPPVFDEAAAQGCTGGQPGKVTLNGALVKPGKDQASLDSRFQFKQMIGQSSNQVLAKLSIQGESALSHEADFSFLKALSRNKTYFNSGCILTNADTEGLTEFFAESSEDNDDTAISIFVTKAFFCGSQNSQRYYYLINTDELVLKDANFNLENFIGAIYLNAAKINLIGHNQITTKGARVGALAMTGPSVEMIIAKEVQGDGSMLIETAGADCPTLETK
ncbi:MAG: hypothetical protein H7328_03875 [Bdellovibrio sp.]|nr:hypothetical protein [Bdellovibrio sp.]